MALTLDSVDVRVFGALIEKALSTPDYYPLSLNALTNACNQSSNREPVMQLTEDEVIAATDRLRRVSLVRALQKSDSRVMKYYHLADETLNLDTREQAVLCVMLLRGPQTLGELATRTARLAAFDDGATVEGTLHALGSRAEPLATRMERQPGQKEARYAHLLSGNVVPQAHEAVTAPIQPAADRLGALEATIDEIRRELADMRRQLNEFRKQFE